jgi:inner membrane protein
MDTSTHILIGFGLAALAQVDPVVSGSETLTQAVIIGSVIGSNAPDFDILYKLKGSSSYCKNHRSYSHSLPLLPLWALLILAVLAPFFPYISYLHLFLWIFLAVVIHVGSDLFNVHGTQVLLPFSRAWISFDIIPLLDPFITTIHLAGFFCLFFFEPGSVFSSIYGLILIYILIRVLYRTWITHQLKGHFTHANSVTLIPKASILKWDVLIETEEDFLFGTYFYDSLRIEYVVAKKSEFPDVLKNCPTHPVVNDFLSSTNYAFPFVEKRKNGYFILWKDLRFRHKKFFPYLAIMFLSSDGLQIYSTFSGWCYSLKQLRRVMRKIKSSKTAISKHQSFPFLNIYRKSSK